MSNLDIIRDCALRALHYLGSMDWQQVVALLIVAATGAIFLWRRLRPRKFDFKRDTHCGCSAAANAAPQASVTFRARKGERSQIIVKSS